MITDPQPGDVLEHGRLMCVIVNEYKDRVGRRWVTVLWLDNYVDQGDRDQLISSYHGDEVNWRGWKKVCGSV